MYMHEKIPWERIMRMTLTPKLFHIKDYQPLHIPPLPTPCMLKYLNINNLTRV